MAPQGLSLQQRLQGPHVVDHLSSQVFARGLSEAGAVWDGNVHRRKGRMSSPAPVAKGKTVAGAASGECVPKQGGVAVSVCCVGFCSQGLI